MSQELARLFGYLNEAELEGFERDRQDMANQYQSKAAAAQREAQAARKELKRRKRNETDSTGR